MIVNFARVEGVIVCILRSHVMFGRVITRMSNAHGATATFGRDATNAELSEALMAPHQFVARLEPIPGDSFSWVLTRIPGPPGAMGEFQPDWPAVLARLSALEELCGDRISALEEAEKRAAGRAETEDSLRALNDRVARLDELFAPVAQDAVNIAKLAGQAERADRSLLACNERLDEVSERATRAGVAFAACERRITTIESELHAARAMMLRASEVAEMMTDTMEKMKLAIASVGQVANDRVSACEAAVAGHAERIGANLRQHADEIRELDKRVSQNEGDVCRSSDSLHERIDEQGTRLASMDSSWARLSESLAERLALAVVRLDTIERMTREPAPGLSRAYYGEGGLRPFRDDGSTDSGSPEARRLHSVAAWRAINRYARACGGDTGPATASEERQKAVVDVVAVLGPPSPEALRAELDARLIEVPDDIEHNGLSPALWDAINTYVRIVVCGDDRSLAQSMIERAARSWAYYDYTGEAPERVGLYNGSVVPVAGNPGDGLERSKDSPLGSEESLRRARGGGSEAGTEFAVLEQAVNRARKELEEARAAMGARDFGNPYPEDSDENEEWSREFRHYASK